MINIQSTLFHDLFDVAITQSIGQILTDGLENNFLVKMTSFEADDRDSLAVVLDKNYHTFISVLCYFATEPEAAMRH